MQYCGSQWHVMEWVECSALLLWCIFATFLETGSLPVMSPTLLFSSNICENACSRSAECVPIVCGNVVGGKFLWWSYVLFPFRCCAYKEERVEDLGSYIILLSNDPDSLIFLSFPLSSFPTPTVSQGILILSVLLSHERLRMGNCPWRLSAGAFEIVTD